MNAFLKSFVYAFRGLAVLFSERSLRFQLAAAVVVAVAGFYFRITAVEWCIVLLSIGLVIGLEMMNTAIENLVDLVTQEWKPLAGKIKDIGAGAVLVAAMMSAIVGVIIFYKYILAELL